jgi:hypothetical protein
MLTRYGGYRGNKIPGAIGDTLRDLHLEEGKGTINYVNEYTYLGVRITKDGNSKP